MNIIDEVYIGLQKRLWSYIMKEGVDPTNRKLGKLIGLAPNTVGKFLKGAEIERSTLVKIERFLDKDDDNG